MIIELLLDVIYTVLDFLLFFEIPLLTDEVHGYINSFFAYLCDGASILANFTPLPYLAAIFTIILAVDGGILIYKFVLWVLRKIPMAGIS